MLTYIFLHQVNLRARKVSATNLLQLSSSINSIYGLDFNITLGTYISYFELSQNKEYGLFCTRATLSDSVFCTTDQSVMGLYFYFIIDKWSILHKLILFTFSFILSI